MVSRCPSAPRLQTLIVRTLLRRSIAFNSGMSSKMCECTSIFRISAKAGAGSPGAGRLRRAAARRPVSEKAEGKLSGWGGG